MKKTWRRALWMIGIIVVLFFGVGIYARLRLGTAAQNMAATTPMYLTNKVSSGSFTGQAQASGTIVPNAEATIQSPSNSTLSTLNVNLGQQVASGATIATLSSGELLSTPITGLVVDAATQSGSYVTTGQTIATVADTSSVYANLTVPEQYIAHVVAGEAVTLTMPALPNQTFTGTVTEVGQLGTANSQGTVQFPVTVKLNNANNAYFGMTANAVINTGTVTNTLAVPSAAIETINGRTAVLVPSSELPASSTGSGIGVKGGYKSGRSSYSVGAGYTDNLTTTTPVTTYVTVGLTNQSQTQITSGLKAGQQVLISNPAAATSTGGAASSAAGRGGMKFHL